MHECSVIPLASFSLCMTLCFILTCCHWLYFSSIYFMPPVLYVSRDHLVRNVHSCFGWQPGKICIYFCKFEVKKPNLRLTRPYPLTRFKRRDFWPLPSDFPITHPNPIWKQCLGVTWCCLNLISSYFVFPNNNIPTPSQFWAVLCAWCGAIEHAENGPYKLRKGNRNRIIV